MSKKYNESNENFSKYIIDEWKKNNIIFMNGEEPTKEEKEIE